MADFIRFESLNGVWTRSLPRFEDERGFFEELFRESEAPQLVPPFIQDSLSFSRGNVLRGLHVQVDQWQLVTLLRGELLDVLLDVSPHSENYGQSRSIELSESGTNQILLQPGIAHGYAILSEDVLIHYKSTVYYGDTDQFGVLWSSPELSVHWPRKSWTVSTRDSAFPTVQEFLKSGAFK